MRKKFLLILGSTMLFTSACSGAEEKSITDVKEENLIEEKLYEEEATSDYQNLETELHVVENKVFINGVTVGMTIDEVIEILGEPDILNEDSADWYFNSDEELGIFIGINYSGIVDTVSVSGMAGEFDEALKKIGFDVQVTDAMVTYDESQKLEYFYHPRIDTIILSSVDINDVSQSLESPQSLNLTLYEFQELFNQNSIATFEQFNNTVDYEIEGYPILEEFKELQDGFFYADLPSFSFVGELNSEGTIRWIALRIPITGETFYSEDYDTSEKAMQDQFLQMIARQAMVHAIDSSVNMDTIYAELSGQQYKEFKDVAEILLGDYKIIGTSSEYFDIFVISTADDDVDLTDYM